LPGLRWIAVISHDAGATPPHRPQRQMRFESLFADSCRPPAPRDRSLRALQRAVYIRHDVAAEGGAVDPRQRLWGAK